MCFLNGLYCVASRSSVSRSAPRKEQQWLAHLKHLEKVLLRHLEALKLLLVLDDALGERLKGLVVGLRDDTVDSTRCEREDSAGRKRETDRSLFMPIS